MPVLRNLMPNSGISRHMHGICKLKMPVTTPQLRPPPLSVVASYLQYRLHKVQVELSTTVTIAWCIQHFAIIPEW